MKNLLTATNVASVAVVSAALLLLAPTSASFAGAAPVGYGALTVSSASVLNGYAVAGGTFDNGFKFKMNVTVDPTTADQLKFKFANWMQNSGSGSIPTTGNMKVGFANNSNTASAVAPTYSTALPLGSDLDGMVPGVQKEAYIWLKVPSGTDAGTYSTTYGIMSDVSAP